MKSAPVKELAEIWQVITRRASNFTQLQAGTMPTNVCLTDVTVPLLDYYNASGTHTMTYSISYGVYPAAVAATFSNTSSDTPTVTLKAPTINARCHASYFALDRAPEVDQANTKFKLVGDLYRVKGRTLGVYNQYADIINMYHNPL